MTKTQYSDLKALAARHGVTVDYVQASTGRSTGEHFPATIELTAPAGLAFVSSGNHCDYSIQGDIDGSDIDADTALTELKHVLYLGFDDEGD